jgi:hypothetical protein
VTRLPLLIALAALALLPASAAAKPPVCSPTVIEDALIAAGKLTQEGIGFGQRVDLVRCHDVTNDDKIDAVFTVASGGTAGDIHFGVLLGRADGSSGRLALYREGYKVGVAVRSRRAFEVLQPHYRPHEPNCCPSSFRLRRFTWNGDHFKRGSKARKLKHAPRRFYKA